MDDVGTSPPAGGRRAQQRRQLLADIEAAARRLLDEGGAANVSMRAIAREVGIGPASLYTYFDGLDAVLTMLLLASYGRLAEATSAAAAHFADDPAIDRALAVTLAYRRWGLDHPNELNLVFTDQLPGYAAPEGGPTIDAQVEVFRPLTDAVAELSSAPKSQVDDSDEARAGVWAAFHGFVLLEANHHLVWLDDPGAAYERAVRRAFAATGLPTPSSDVRPRFDRWAGAPS
ncbi:MAG: TetR/AcrR family transcriptional regulator [Acidimicrobiales bacterium]|nr:TetR/AcrR family transcriptional regulator [Acidimicrobiales bacterium]